MSKSWRVEILFVLCGFDLWFDDKMSKSIKIVIVWENRYAWQSLSKHPIATKSPRESLTRKSQEEDLTECSGTWTSRSKSKIFTILSFTTNKTYKKINSFPTVVLSSNQIYISISIPGDGFFGRPPDSIERWRNLIRIGWSWNVKKKKSVRCWTGKSLRNIYLMLWKTN